MTCPRCESVEPVPIHLGTTDRPDRSGRQLVIGGCDPSIYWPVFAVLEVRDCGLMF